MVRVFIALEIKLICCITMFFSPRFPTMHELVRTGLVRSDEAIRIGEEDSLEMYGSNWWLPLKWCVEILSRAQEDGLIKSPPGYSHMMLRISEFRNALIEVATYVHIPVPLVYTQVRKLSPFIASVLIKNSHSYWVIGPSLVLITLDNSIKRKLRKQRVICIS